MQHFSQAFYTTSLEPLEFFLLNLGPQSVPDPVTNTDLGINRLAVHVGSTENAGHWLSQWTLDYMDHKASCIPGSVATATRDVTLASSSDSLPAASQGPQLSASLIGRETSQPFLPNLSVHLDAAESHLSLRQCAPPSTLPLLDHQSLHLDLPPASNPLYQVVVVEVVGSHEPTVLVDSGPLTEGAAINAVFNQYVVELSEAGPADVSILLAFPTSSGSSQTLGSLWPSPTLSAPPRGLWPLPRPIMSMVVTPHPQAVVGLGLVRPSASA